MAAISCETPSISWSPEDVDAVKETLAEEFPAMAEQVIEAVVARTVAEVTPLQGQAAFHRLAVRYARECPSNLGVEAALAMLSSRPAA